jgi:WD40 repeat protein
VLATGSWDRTVRLWDGESGQQLACLEGHQERVTALAWWSGGRFLRSTDAAGRTIDWDTETAQRLPVREGERFQMDLAVPAASLSFSAEPRAGGVAFYRGHEEEPAAWFPLQMSVVSRDGRTWAGIVGSELYLLRVEG